MTDLTTLEDEVLRALLSGEQSAIKALRDQLPGLKVLDRTMTGAGFFTRLSVARVEAALSPAIDTAVGGAAAEIDGLERGAGFVVFVRQGLLDTLEGYSFEEAWPEHIVAFRVYATEAPRTTDL